MATKVVRICATDNKPLPQSDDPRMDQAGWYCCDDYYCSQECLDKSFEGEKNDDGTPMTWLSHYEDNGGDNGSDCYYTEWEKEYEEE